QGGAVRAALGGEPARHSGGIPGASALAGGWPRLGSARPGPPRGGELRFRRLAYASRARRRSGRLAIIRGADVHAPPRRAMAGPVGNCATLVRAAPIPTV